MAWRAEQLCFVMSLKRKRSLDKGQETYGSLLDGYCMFGFYRSVRIIYK